MKRIIIAFSLSVLFCIPSFAQVYANKDLPLKIDPPKIEDYPYMLPIWGKKAIERGFQLPYSKRAKTQTTTRRTAPSSRPPSADFLFSIASRIKRD